MHPLRSTVESVEIDCVPPFFSPDALLNRPDRFRLDHGYEALEAGSGRGPLYHRLKHNERLVLAVLDQVEESWSREVGPLVDRESEPVAALIALARGHAVFCRQDLARLTLALKIDFSGQDQAVGRKLDRGFEELVGRCARLITAGRGTGSIPAGPPATTVALAFVGATEGVVIELDGQAPHDEALAARAAAGVLGLDQEAIA